MSDTLNTERLVVEKVPIHSIQPNSYNPNFMTEEQFDLLLASIRSDGFTQPIIVQREGRVIVDGFHRWTAAKALGYEYVPVVLVTLTQQQQYLATLQHNWARGTEVAGLAALVMKDLLESMTVDDLASELNVSTEDIKLEIQANLPDVNLDDLFPELADQDGDGIPAEASDLLRQRERQSVVQGQAEESAMTIKDRTDYYFVSFSFTVEEGEIVRKAMLTEGESLPDAFIALCRKAVTNGW